jgi:hypothetical protein
MTKADTSFWNIVILYFYNSDDGQCPDKQYYIKQ